MAVDPQEMEKHRFLIAHEAGYALYIVAAQHNQMAKYHSFVI